MIRPEQLRELDATGIVAPYGTDSAKEGMRCLLHSGFPKLGRAEVDVLAHCVA